MPSTYRAYINKLSNKIRGTAHMPARGKKKGDALLSYLVSPFTQTPKESHMDPHANYWECAEIARLLAERGYAVDIIQWNDEAFIPKKKYKICIDTQKRLERLAPLLPSDCKKVMHVVSSYGEFQNNAEQKRLANLKSRRGIELKAQRTESPSTNPRFAAYMEGFGNDTVYATYARFGKDIFPIHESVSKTFDFPANKNFATAKKSFLWFGGGGAVHKGLDMVLEAFATTPDLHLHIVGPVAAEKDFMEAYKSELSLPNVTLHGRPKIDQAGNMSVNGVPFSQITDMCGALMYMSCSEGTSGAAVQAVHAGLYPIITPETGIDERAPATLISEPTVEKIRSAALEFAALSDNDVEAMARKAWSFIRAFYSKPEFSRTYALFLDTILKA
ncbi:MAG TPA: hypothetical protein VHD69_02440 [Candidatus Paceibacterota bacterium]|nr:hypothetical protein [Candidatus Paceibacterota bacterium]